jgi:hypothetical protein
MDSHSFETLTVHLTAMEEHLRLFVIAEALPPPMEPEVLDTVRLSYSFAAHLSMRGGPLIISLLPEAVMCLFWRYMTKLNFLPCVLQAFAVRSML